MSLPNPNDITAYPPIWPSAKFNTYLFQGNNYITRQQADLLYASVYSIRNIKYINDVTEGIASAQKALILDSSKNITGINNIQSATIDCNGLDINNSTDLNLYGTTNSIHLHSTVSSTIMMSGTIFNSITMQASSGFILMSGANQYVYLSGTSNYLRIDNNTASTSSTTGSLRIAGGAYFGNHCLYNGNITLQGLSAILNLSGASSIISLSNTSASTSSTSGAIQCAGGAYFGANSLFGGNVTMNGSLNVGTVGTSDNRINFSGLTGDSGTNHTVIAERIYEASSEKSELLLFKGNDPAPTVGPDRIRMRASEFRFQTYTTAEDYSGMSDNNNRLIISNSGDISISSTSASTSSTTGAIQCSGGIYTGGDCLFNTNFQVNGIVKMTYNEASTSSATGTLRLTGGIYVGQSSIMAANLTLNGTSSTLNLTGASSVISISNTSASTSSTTGALRVAGGAYFGANSLFAGNVCIGGSTDTSRLISALTSSLAIGSSNKICFGKENSSGNQAEFTYTVGTTSANNKLSIGFHSTPNIIQIFNKLDDELFGNMVKIGNPPDALGTINSNLEIKLSMALVDVNSNSCKFTSSGRSLEMSLCSSNGTAESEYTFYINSLTMGRLDNKFRLDLGQHGARSGTNDFLICLYNDNNGLPTTGIGYTVNNNLFITSSGSNGIIFRNNNGISGPDSIYNTGTRTHQMYKSGHFEATSGIRAGEYSNPPYTGKGVEMHWSTSANLGDVFAYDRTGGTFLPLRFNNIIYTTPSNSRVGINKASPDATLDVAGNVFITSPANLTPLVINGTGGWSRSGTFGWLQSSGAGNATGFTNRSFSIYSSGGILVDSGEIDSFSDIRMKKNIQEITEDKALLFLKINPINFLYNNQDDNSISHIGYRAQDFVKYNFNDIVGFTDIREETKLERQTITTIDGNEIILEEDIKLTINQLSVIPYLHKLVQIQNKLIIDNQKLIESLQNQLKEMRSDDETIYDMIEDIHNFLNITTE